MDPAPLAPTSLSVKQGLQEAISSGRNSIFYKACHETTHSSAAYMSSQHRYCSKHLEQSSSLFPTPPALFVRKFKHKSPSTTTEALHPQRLNVRNRTMPVHNVSQMPLRQLLRSQ